MRLLVVDDDAVFREELAELLAQEGHTIATAPSAPKALEELDRTEYDAVLTDLKMPRQSGLDLLREVRHRWPRTLVVVITGYATVETAIDAMKEGAFDYVRKPFRIERLRETLQLISQEHARGIGLGAMRDPIREARTLAAGGKYEVVLFSPVPVPAEPHLHVEPLEPGDLVRLSDRARSFVERHPNAAVVIAASEQLLERHRLEDVVGLLDRLQQSLEGRGPLRVGFNPRRLPPSAVAALGGAVAAEATHETLEAFASPIRRRVLQRLALGPASFGELMRASEVDDSPKISFHLRKLVDAGLLRHEDDTYRLTPRGEAGVRLLVDASFLPPASDSESMAFPGRTPPSSRVR